MKAPLQGGYILLSRKLMDSGIWNKPPLYLKVWLYLLARAQHQDYKDLKRGQLWTSIPEIQKAMTYKVGYRKEQPTKKQIWGVLEWLRNPYEGTTGETMVEPMIETTKGTHGILVTIVNYGLYQDPKNYEGNAESSNEGTAKERRRERQGNNINKNDKNDKNDKNINDDELIVAASEKSEVGEVILHAERTWGRPITQNEQEIILTAYEGFEAQSSPEPIAITKYAIEVSGLPEIRVKSRYFDTITRSWLQNGILTLDKAKGDYQRLRGEKSHEPTGKNTRKHEVAPPTKPSRYAIPTYVNGEKV